MKERILLLKSEILDDKARIDRLFEKFQLAWSAYLSGKEYSRLVESAFVVNQIYTGFERIFRNIAMTFENSIGEGLWHRTLLERMRIDVEEIRPRLLSEMSFTCLNELLAFRHYFRHAYDSDIAEDKFSVVVTSTQQLRKCIAEDIELFLRFLDQLVISDS